MNKNFKIDEWDFKIINIFKSHIGETALIIDKIKKIWGERCALDPDYVRVSDINDRLIKIVYYSDVLNDERKFIDFINNFSEKNNWKFRHAYNKDNPDFDLMLLSRLDSLLSLARIDEIPGYEDFLRNELKETNSIFR